METIQISDEALVTEMQNDGAAAELFGRYEQTIRAIAANYFVAGADADDVIQEGRIGLFKAVVNYSPDRSDKFRPFALMCIKRQIQTAAMSASRKKHMPLNSYVPLDKTVLENDEDGGIFEAAEAEGKNPESILIDRENREDIGYIINNSLNPAEREVLALYIQGVSYKDIARMTNRTVKSVDNAIQSIKRRLKAKIG